MKTADWDGSRWSAVTTLSKPGSGSQTGLVGTVLSDGSSLLVWSRFDGKDDELYFSWRQTMDWSQPRRVSPDNEHPDVAPSVTFTRQGALLAWSRFDGSNYQIWSSAFERGEWTGESPAGGRGALYPQLLHHDDSLFLVSRSSSPAGWSVHRASRNGSIAGRSFIAAETTQRPLLVDSSPATVTLAWPQEQLRQEALLEVVP